MADENAGQGSGEQGSGEKPDNGGTQTAVNGKCPEGFIHVFGPLCVEQTTLAKFEEALPDMPEFDFTNPGCEAALAALNDAMKSVEQAIEMPKKLMGMAKDLVEKPFDTAKQMVDSALGVMDDISSMIDELISGPAGMISEFKSSLEAMLSCPFIADMPIAKTAAGLLDSLDGGLPIDGLLSQFKGQLSSAAGECIDKVAEQPLGALDNMSSLYDDMLERAGVGDLLKKAQELEQCLKAACNMAEVMGRVPASVESTLGSLNGSFDKATGKLKAALVKPATESAKAAQKVAQDITIIKTAGKG